MKIINTCCTSFIILLLVITSLTLDAQSDQYLHFDKVDDFIEVPVASQYIANADGVTLSGWFFCDALGYGQGMFGFRNGGTGDGEMYMIQLGEGRLENRFVTNNNFSEVQTGSIVEAQKWQHYAFVWNGSTVQLFLDGVLVGTGSSKSIPITSIDTPFAIGKLISPFNFIYGGRIDEVTMWSKALTIEEINDMIDNELEGDEAGLELYYKFNQGIPDGDNTSIAALKCEVGDGERDGILQNFALTGSSSNFGGELEGGFQAISFPMIGDKLIDSEDFQLDAIASSGLPVAYEIISGPATVTGDIVSLNGNAGEVFIRASQGGDEVYDMAESIETSFMVLDPAVYVPIIDARAPVSSTVMYAPDLGPIRLSAISSIGSPDLFHVSGLKFVIDGVEIEAKDWGNNHYTGWWTPPAHGSYTLHIISENNYGAVSDLPVDFEVVDTASDIEVNAATEVHISVDDGEETVTAILPTYLGGFDHIQGYLDIGCPTGGCDPWDRISRVEVKGHDGQWREIIRYLTPYGIACNHDVDLTDFASLLYGKVDFRFKLGTQGNGFLYTLNLNYQAGSPEYKYSQVERMWEGSYDFGNLENLQPYEHKSIDLHDNTESVKLKLVATGHGWGDNNTGNAAEFHYDTHHVMVDDEVAYAHYNFLDCDPNPDGCNNQAGTYKFNRAGWCPGAIAPWNDFDLTDFISDNEISLHYRLNQGYIDYCHPNNPDCVSGQTCPDCNDGFNPHLVTVSYIVSKGDSPLEDSQITGAVDIDESIAFKIHPNPTTDKVYISFDSYDKVENIELVNNLGITVIMKKVGLSTGKLELEVDDLPSGIYYISLISGSKVGTQTLIIH